MLDCHVNSCFQDHCKFQITFTHKKAWVSFGLDKWIFDLDENTVKSLDNKTKTYSDDVWWDGDDIFTYNEKWIHYIRISWDWTLKYSNIEKPTQEDKDIINKDSNLNNKKSR